MKLTLLLLSYLFGLSQAQTRSWQLGPVMPSPRSDMAVVAVDQRAFIIAGCMGRQGFSGGYYTCSDLANDALVFDMKQETYTTIDNCPTPRYRHTAVLYQEKIYVVGGRSLSDDIITNLDILDPSTLQWTSADASNAAVSDSAAFVLMDTFYVVGGWTSEYAPSSAVYAFNGSGFDVTDYVMPSGRGDIAVAVWQGSAYIAGGWSDETTPLVDVEIFNGSSWTAGPDLPTGRGDKGMFVLNDMLHVVGGESIENNSHSAPLDVVEILDFAQQQWDVVLNLSLPRFRFSVVTFENKAFLFGGQGSIVGEPFTNGSYYPLYNSTEIYIEEMTTPTPTPSQTPMPSSSAGVTSSQMSSSATPTSTTTTTPPATPSSDAKWTSAGELPEKMSDFAVAVDYTNEHFYLIGGCVSDQTFSNGFYSCPQLTSRCMYFDSNLDFEDCTSLSMARARSTAVVYKQTLFVVGGRTLSDDVISNVEHANLDKPMTWATLSSSGPAVSDATSFVLGNVLYVVGGWLQDYTASKHVFALSDLDAGFSMLPDKLPEARGDIASVVVQGNAYVTGGWSHANSYMEPYDHVYVLSGSTLKWTSISPLPTARGDKALVAHGNVIYAIGGEGLEGSALLEVERYNTNGDSWTIENTLQEARFRFGAVVSRDRILVFGGQGALVGKRNTNESYFPLLRTIESYELDPLPVASAGEKKTSLSSVAVALIVLVCVSLVVGGVALVVRKRNTTQQIKDGLSFNNPLSHANVVESDV